MTPSNINWHNVRMYSLIIVTFLATGLSAIMGLLPPSTALALSSGLTLLTGIEHYLQGNTGTPAQ